MRISATAARNRFFELLDQVALGQEVIIEKDKKEVAVLAPRKTKTDWEGLLKASHAVHGIFKEYTVDELLPIRKNKSWRRLGKWDRGLSLHDKSISKKKLK